MIATVFGNALPCPVTIYMMWTNKTSTSLRRHRRFFTLLLFPFPSQALPNVSPTVPAPSRRRGPRQVGHAKRSWPKRLNSCSECRKKLLHSMERSIASRSTIKRQRLLASFLYNSIGNIKAERIRQHVYEITREHAYQVTQDRISLSWRASY